MKFAICYDGIEIIYFDNWCEAEQYLYEVYESKEHTGFYIKKLTGGFDE